MASDTLAARAVNTRTESADTSGVGTEATSLYRFGWHVDLWDRGRNANAIWHAAGVVAWRLWNAPSDHARVLRRLQTRRVYSSLLPARPGLTSPALGGTSNSMRAALDILSPKPVATEAFTDASAAVARLEEIYERNTGFLRDRFEAYAKGEPLEARVR